jgi:hypothetical protein
MTQASFSVSMPASIVDVPPESESVTTLTAELVELLGRVLRDVAAAGHQAGLAFEGLATRLASISRAK